jgi:hygromycin-B 4-O-kinase
MLQPRAVSLPETTQFLIELYGSGVSDVAPIGEGAWSQAFAFTHDGVKQVIRWSFLSANFERDAAAARFCRPDLPIPTITTMGKSGEQFYAISSFVEGDYLEALPVTELEQTLSSLLRMLRALRTVDLSDWTGFGFWRGDGKASHPRWKAFLLDDKEDGPGSLIKGWRANLAASPLGMEPFERLWRRFVPMVENCPDERRLVHSDLVNRNVLADGGRISAVLDWGSSIVGDALYDVAWFVFYQPWFPQFVEIDLARRLLDDYSTDPNANTTDLEARLRCYLTHIGLDSIAYNAFIRNWANAREAADYTLELISR